MNPVFYVISDWFMTLFIERPSYDPSNTEVDALAN